MRLTERLMKEHLLTLTREDLQNKFIRMKDKFIHLEHFKNQEYLKSVNNICYSYEEEVTQKRTSKKILRMRFKTLKKKGCISPKKYKTCKKRTL